MSRPRIVVLGAGGFVGRRMVAALAASGRHVPVAALRRPATGLLSGVEQVTVDATSAESLAAALAGADGVVNSIAGSRAAILGNAQALAAWAATRPDRPSIVHLSTMSVYGAMRGRVAEDAAPGAVLDDYGDAKWQAECLLAPVAGLTTLRPGIVYGPDSPLWSGLIGELLLAGRLGDLGAAGAGCCNLVHVDDVAAAVLHALDRPAPLGRVCNLAIDAAPSWNQYFAAFGAALGLGEVPAIGSARLALELKLCGPLLKVGEKLGMRRLPPAIRPWLTRLCRDDTRLDGSRSAAELGFRHRPLAEGLADTAAWFRQRREGLRA